MTSPFWSSGEHCSASFCCPAHRPLHQGCWLCSISELPGLVAAPPGVRAGSSPLVRSRLRALFTTGLFVANACLSCLALGRSLQLGSSPHDHLEALFLLSLKSFGFRASLSFRDFVRPLHFVCLFFLCSGDSGFPTSLFSRPLTLSGTRDKLEVRSS